MARSKRKSASSTTSEKAPTEETPTAAPSNRLQQAKHLLEQLSQAELQKLFHESVIDPDAPFHHQINNLFVMVPFGPVLPNVRVHHEDTQALLANINTIRNGIRENAMQEMRQVIPAEKFASLETGEASGRNWREQRTSKIIHLKKQGLSLQQIADKLNDELRADPALTGARAFVDKDGKNGVDGLIDGAHLTKSNVDKILKKAKADAEKVNGRKKA